MKHMRTNSRTAWIPALSASLVLAACGGSGDDYGGGDGGTPPPAAPTVVLTPPAASAGELHRTVALTATPNAAAGVSRVEFLVDGTMIGSDTTSPYSVDWDTSTVADGSHAVAARVVDMANAEATSVAVNITVNNHPVIDVELTPGETFPVPASSASGAGQITVDLVSGAISGQFTVSGLTATLAHIHSGYAGASGGVLVDFVQDTTDPNLWNIPAGSLLTAEQVDDLLAGKLYVNVHSAAYPVGEIRGQIKPANITVIVASMDGAQVVPAVTTTVSGRLAVTVDSAASTATVHVNATGADDATAAELHRGASGSNGDLQVALTQDSVSPGHWSVEQHAITSTDIGDFTGGGWYVDLRTPVNPSGEIRGQVTLPATPPPASVTLSQLQTDVFSPRCAGCHNGIGSGLPGSMDLSSAAASYIALVGVASIEQPALSRVAVSDPANSYLVQKLEGAAGITGGRMPLGGPFLDQPTIDQVKSWIAAGALNN